MSDVADTKATSAQVQFALDVLTAFEKLDADAVIGYCSDDFEYYMLPKAFGGPVRSKDELHVALKRALSNLKKAKVSQTR